MAALTTQQRLDILRDLNSKISSERLELTGLVRDDIVAAIADLDDFLDTNAVAINTAIPQPARGALSTRQKALLLDMIIVKRYGV